MRQQHGEPATTKRKLALVLGVAAGFFWLVALALPVFLIVLIGNVPGEDPERTERAFVIGFGAFLSFALLAIPATIGSFVVRRAGVRRNTAGPNSI